MTRTSYRAGNQSCTTHHCDRVLQFVLHLSQATFTLTRSLPSIPFDLSALLAFITQESSQLESEALWQVIMATFCLVPVFHILYYMSILTVFFS